MSDHPTERRTYLEASIDQRLGALTLSLKLELSTSWTVLFGPSGAGKTSLLRFLAGFYPPDARMLSPHRFRHRRSAGIQSGRIEFQGRLLMDADRGIWISPSQRGIGFVTQRPALFENMSAAENVAFGLSRMPGHHRDRRVGEMLRLFSAEALADRKPAALSGGEKQRIALARALAPEPKMLLLDEPFTGLDNALKDDILVNLTEWLRRRGIPALYVSHDVAEVFQTEAEVIVLENGVITANGRPEDVLFEERRRLLDHLQAPFSYPTETGSISR